MNESFIMIENSKKLIVRRSFLVFLVVGFTVASATPVLAETGYVEEDVGVADVYEDIFDSDVEDEGDIDIDSGVDPDIGIDSDSEHGDNDAGYEGDSSGSSDSGTGEPSGNNDAGADFLFVELGVEVQFDGDAPDVVTLGLRSNFGEVGAVDVSVSDKGLAVWEIESLQAGVWVLSATADGYEAVDYRFVAGDMSQMLVRVSMGKSASFADTKVESGWACSAAGSDAGPSMLILFTAFVGSMWIQRRRNL